jgi:hypothetical protein
MPANHHHCGMTRRQQGIGLAIVVVAAIYAVLMFANFWPLDRQCPWVFPKIFGCVLGARETLAGGLVASGGAIFAAWLAWSAVREARITRSELERRSERQAFEAIQRELAPLLDLLNVAWRIIEETLDYRGSDEEQMARVTTVRTDVAWTLPPVSLVDEIEATATDLSPAHRRQLARVAFNIRLLYRLVEDLKQDRNRVDELRWRLHEFKLLTIQLSHLRASVAIFDDESTRRFADRRPVVLNQENWAKQLEDLHAAWLEQERRVNLHRRG